MRFPRVGAPKKNDVRLFHFAVGAGAPSRAENRRQTGDARGVSSPIATIDVVAADHRANELLRDIVELVRGLGATEHSKGARSEPANFAADTIRGAIKRFFPRCCAMLSVLAD